MRSTISDSATADPAVDVAYLFEIADRRDPLGHLSESDDVPTPLTELLAEIRVPAYLMGRYWDMLAWNVPAAELFSGWLDRQRDHGAQSPYLLRFVFLDAGARRFLVDWEARARRIAARNFGPTAATVSTIRP